MKIFPKFLRISPTSCCNYVDVENKITMNSKTKAMKRSFDDVYEILSVHQQYKQIEADQWYAVMCRLI